MQHYAFHPTVVVRNPLIPFSPESLTETQIRALLHEEWFMEAIFLASPELHRQSIAWREGAVPEKRKEDKLLASLTKYYSRMMSRCTPFGLFTGCGAIAWGEGEYVDLDPENSERHTRLDMHFSSALALEASRHPAVKKYLRYSPNTSLYPIGDELRYVEYQYINGKRLHQITAINRSEYVEAVLQKARTGAVYDELAEVLVCDVISWEDAAHFLDELIAAQVVVSDLEPTITGGDFTEQVARVVERIVSQTQNQEIAQLYKEIRQLQDRVKALDTSKGNGVNHYRTVIEQIKEAFGGASPLSGLCVAVEENKLFQTDLFRAATSQTLPAHWQADIAAALEVLNRLAGPRPPQTTLQAFAERFYARYEDREVPLLEALDTETGVGYAENSQAHAFTPLVEDLQLPLKEHNSTLTWDTTRAWLFRKLQTAVGQQSYAITIEDRELQELPEADWEDVSPSLSVMFRWIEEEHGQKRILIENAGGASALSLLGRFAYGQEPILTTVQEIAAAEQAHNPDVLFAEIIHLPESRTGNILMHPPFRAYEIPFLGQSSLSPDNQIPLQDLRVSVRGGSVILRSEKLNKRVIPRLSNAHNYRPNTLPVYHFLGDLQYQNKRTRLSFDWGPAAEHVFFLPRVTYRNTIISPAIWQLTKQEAEGLLSGTLSLPIPSFRERLTVLADGDNELLIDWDNPLSVLAFRDAVKNRERIQLKEFLYERHRPILREKPTGRGFVNQCIALLV